MNENLRGVLIATVLCVFLIFGYIKRENIAVGFVSPTVLVQPGNSAKQNLDPLHIIHRYNFSCNGTSKKTITSSKLITADVTTNNNHMATERTNIRNSPTFLQKNLTSLFNAQNTINNTCPKNNDDNWSFNCTVPCVKAPVPMSTNSTYSHIYIDCNGKIPTSRIVTVETGMDIQTMPANSECLYNYVLQNCFDEKLVPNLVHYVWFSKREMHFYNFLSFISASKYQKPCLILIHGDYQPFGTYWNFLLTLVPNIVHVKRYPPETVYGKPLGNIEHKADVGRIQALERFGGIYLDTDEIILRSLDTLRRYPFTMSHAVDSNLSNGLILSEPNAAFLKLWMAEYITYTKAQWAYHSTIVPNLLSKKYPDLIHIENKTFVRPNYTQLPLLFKMNFNWSKNYAIHLYIRFYKIFHDFNDIRHLNTTMGSVARHVLYGSKELCENKQL